MCVCIYVRRPLPSFGLGGAAPGITAGVQPWPARTTRPASAHLSGPSKLPGHESLKSFETAKLPGMYLLPHVSGLLRPPCLTPAFQGAWSCIFKGFRNCYVARFSQAWKALKPQKPQTAPAFQAAWACIFKGFRNCYVARFSQAWKALKPQKPQTV